MSLINKCIFHKIWHQNGKFNLWYCLCAQQSNVMIHKKKTKDMDVWKQQK